MSPEDVELAQDFGVTPCTTEVQGQCCKQDEVCKCRGDVLQIFPAQCSIEPTYCEPKGTSITVYHTHNWTKRYLLICH